MNKSFTKIILLNFLVFLISILIIEIFFGHWFSEHSFGPYMREHRLKKDPIILSYNNIEYNFIYKRNYHGFRGEEIEPSKIEAVIIGGSTTDERYKPYEFTITGNLNSLLKKNDYNFKIINAGIEGQSTAGHIYNFQHWFTKLKNFSPKLYIFYVGLNDYNKWENEDFNNLKDYNIGGGDGHVKNPEAIEIFFDYLKSNSFFYDNLRIIKHKYYSKARTKKYDHDFLGKQELNNYKYVNYKEGLELHDHKKLKVKYQENISAYLGRVEILNYYVTKRNSTAIFINQVNFNGVENEIIFIFAHSLIEYCKDKNLHCIDLASKLDGKFDYWYDGIHTTGLGSKAIAEAVIEGLIKIIKQEKIF